MATTDQTRKTGDALILSGQLGGSAKIFQSDADWAGATGEVHIVDAATGAVERSDVCIITPPLAGVNGRYSYIGGPIPAGTYLYEIEVTLTGLQNPITFPNDKTKFKLTVVEQLA